MSLPSTTDSAAMPRTRAHAVAAALRGMILAGELPAGTRLRQLDVAKQFAVSTTPVREAFTMLAREGLVRQDVHRGVVVFAPSRDDISEAYSIRMALEGLAAELAAKRITDDELAELDELLVAMHQALKTDLDYHTRVLNPRFHSIIAKAARSPRLEELISSFRDAAVAYHSAIVEPSVDQDYLDEVQSEHAEIVAALRARNPRRASKIVRSHIEENRKRTLGAIANQLN
jgi:DNA-binding GntR family transcriptional regulator